jgi:8-oxo-dGTP diphosphatase
MEHITNSATRLKVRAAIIRNEHILLVEYGAGWEPHFNLPGGSIEPHEALHDALRREVYEETCGKVDVGRLLLVLEFNKVQVASESVIEFVFEGTLTEGSEARLPEQPDPHQVAVRWVPIDELPHIPLRPKISKELLAVLRAPHSLHSYLQNPPMR